MIGFIRFSHKIKKINPLDNTTSEETTLKKYYYQDGKVLYTKNEDGNVSLNLLSPAGEVIQTSRGSDASEQWYTYNRDDQGSTSSIVDQSGVAVATYDYDEYGNIISQTGNDIGNEVCYTGQIYDESTGLYYYNARFYDPEDGIFTSQDTDRGQASEPSTLNYYAYCAGDPINNIDPSGHSFFGNLFKKARTVVRHAYHKVTSAVKQTYHRAVKAVTRTYHAARRKINYVKKAVKRTYHKVKKKVKKIYRKAKKKAKETAGSMVLAAKKKSKATLKKVYGRSARIKDAVKDKARQAKKHAKSITKDFDNNAKVVGKVSGIYNVAGLVADVGTGVENNVKNNASAEKVVDDAYIDTMFAVIGIGLSTLVTMAIPGVLLGFVLVLPWQLFMDTLSTIHSRTKDP